MAEVIYRTASGGNPVEYILNLGQAVKPTVGDALYAAQRQRTRIVERTFAGRDVNGGSFEPYDGSRPYYYYPNGRVGRTKATIKQNKAAVRRFLKKTEEITTYRAEYLGSLSVGGVKTRSGQGIRFESYADFKESLGRAGVDLTGPRAPHMLQAIECRVNGQNFGTKDVQGGSRAEVTGFSLGIYGEPAARASAHNTGVNPRWKRPHQRYFFGASASDLWEMVTDIFDHIKARLYRGGKQLLNNSFNSTLAGLAGSYGITAFTVDWSAASLQFFQFNGDPDELEQTSASKYPMVFMHAVRSQNTHESLGRNFSGPVEVELTFWISHLATQVIKAGPALETTCNVIEDACNLLFTNGNWPQLYGATNAICMPPTCVRGRVEKAGQSYRQAIQFNLVFTLDTN
jgi:hypothetical protein